MGLFGRIGEKGIKSNGGGVFFEPGKYALEVRAHKTGKTREGRSYFVCEFTILESSNPERPSGTGVSWMVMMDKNLETALGNIKGYVAALMDMSEEDVDEPGIEALISAANPGAGLKVRAVVSTVKKKNGDPFTKPVFETYDKKQAA